MVDVETHKEIMYKELEKISNLNLIMILIYCITILFINLVTYLYIGIEKLFNWILKKFYYKENKFNKK